MSNNSRNFKRLEFADTKNSNVKKVGKKESELLPLPSLSGTTKQIPD